MIIFLGFLMQKYEGRFDFKGSWRLTFLSLEATPCSPEASRQIPALIVSDFYSDLLYQPFHCATTPIRKSWLARSNIDRRSGLSLLKFREQYEKTNQPVVITDIVSDLRDTPRGVKALENAPHSCSPRVMKELENLCGLGLPRKDESAVRQILLRREGTHR